MKALLDISLLTIEKRLRAKGFAAPVTRRVIARQMLLALASLLLGLLAAWLTLWPLAFAAGTFLATGNLYYLGKGLERNILASSATGSAARSNVSVVMHVLLYWARLAVTGTLLYVFIVRCSLPFVPLLAGLSTVVAGLSVTGFSRATGKPCKEA